MPLLTTQSARGYGLTSGVETSTFELIDSTVVGAGGVSQIVFSSIPSEYKHLRIMGSVRTEQSGSSGSALLIQFNGDTGSNYWNHRLYMNGATRATDGSSSAGSTPQIGNAASDGLDSNLWMPNLIDIVDYRSSVHKNIRSWSGGDWNSAAGYLMYNDVLWTNTAAITSIRLFHDTNDLGVNTTMSLYGMRG
jgi:hypothetical protein